MSERRAVEAEIHVCYAEMDCGPYQRGRGAASKPSIREVKRWC